MPAESKYKKLSVLMPVYNEARTLRTIIRRVLNSPVDLPIELISVDDSSKDGSLQVLHEMAATDNRIKIFAHDQNQGKGAAIQTAIKHMTGDIALIQDSDLEYDPADYPILLAPILEGKADAVFGSRFASPMQRKVLMYWHSLGNKIITWLANILNDINLTDMMTCYKAIRGNILKQIPLQSKRFGIEAELTTRLAQWNIRIYEVPVSYHGRSYAEGKKIGLKDAFDTSWRLFKFRFLAPQFATNDGYYILQSLRKAKRFNHWMFSQFNRFIGKEVLEAGCGIGNFTELLLDRQRLICVDNDPFYSGMLEQNFGHLENIVTLNIDLAAKEDYKKINSENIDTVICLNVVEHILNDQEVLENFFMLLKPGGHAIILVPSHSWLYTKCDEKLGHFRRYDKQELKDKLEKAGFELVVIKQFNRLGIFGWYVNGKLGRHLISPFQIRIYEWLMPIAKLLEYVKFIPGLTMLAVGRKPFTSTEGFKSHHKAV